MSGKRKDKRGVDSSRFFREPRLLDIKETVYLDMDTNGVAEIEENGLIKFSQAELFRYVNSGKLQEIKIKYNGLCEIICNYILLEDLLGNNNNLPLEEDVQANWVNIEAGNEQLKLKFKDDTHFIENYRNKYGDKITVENLRKVEDTHILHVTHFFTRLIAVLFSIYPCNLFSNAPFAKLPYSTTQSDDGRTQTLVDKEMLSEKLNQLDDNFYIKFFAFQKEGLAMQGHSMLIKKIGDNNYTFFDPNNGEYTGLNIDGLAEQINNSTKEVRGNQMVFLDARDFLNSYQIAPKEIDSDEATSPMPYR